MRTYRHPNGPRNLKAGGFTNALWRLEERSKMSKNYVWGIAFAYLLRHFDDNEGTTFLYEKSEQEEFLTHIPESIRGDVQKILEVYHQTATK